MSRFVFEEPGAGEIYWLVIDLSLIVAVGRWSLVVGRWSLSVVACLFTGVGCDSDVVLVESVGCGSGSRMGGVGCVGSVVASGSRSICGSVGSSKLVGWLWSYVVVAVVAWSCVAGCCRLLC